MSISPRLILGSFSLDSTTRKLKHSSRKFGFSVASLETLQKLKLRHLEPSVFRKLKIFTRITVNIKAYVPNYMCENRRYYVNLRK